MLKKIKRIIGDLIEKVFKRMELHNIKLEASFLKDRVKHLTSGESVNLDQHERRMILSAIEYVPFREAVELPETKAYIRTIWRRLRRKIQLSIKKEDQPAKEGDEEIIPIPEKPNPGLIDHQYKSDKKEE